MRCLPIDPARQDRAQRQCDLFYALRPQTCPFDACTNAQGREGSTTATRERWPVPQSEPSPQGGEPVSEGSPAPLRQFLEKKSSTAHRERSHPPEPEPPSAAAPRSTFVVLCDCARSNLGNRGSRSPHLRKTRRRARCEEQERQRCTRRPPRRRFDSAQSSLILVTRTTFSPQGYGKGPGNSF